LSWVRSPLLHFLTAGALLFIVSEAWISRLASPASTTHRIEIDTDRIHRLEREFVARIGRRPDAQEMESMISVEVEEEILFQEALARGLLERDGGVQTRLIQKMLFLEGATEVEDAGLLLDRAKELELHREDVVIRRILVQKMRLYASRLDEHEKPSTADVEARYAMTHESLREPDRISFWQIFLSTDERRDKTRSDAEALRIRLDEGSIDLDSALALGDPFPLGHRFEKRSARELARSFGARFGPSALEAPKGSWSKPIESAYGWHLLRIESREPGEIPPPDAVAERIRRNLEREFQEAKFEATLGELRKRYEVVLTGAPEEMG
jgi:peptidyl-prolyl cis-trans isomerase C